MQFNKLRLVGFKSFVEPTELVIEPGMTGLVGPNGCGKSNLVEALSWVMGETSAKQMRGGAMDDIIFSGTATRPSRNLAEVALSLDNAERRAPAPFNDEPELDVSRRIERDAGSTYRINGREVRARDVQLLFADLATGAHSTAIVGQGRVGAVINAKPAARRMLLEEAAGITGLHSRRHEAELRLGAADTNLERLDDVTAQMEGQLHALKRQARQATRYRNLSGHIRRADAVLYHVDHQAAAARLQAAETDLAAADGQVAELTGAAARATTEAADASAKLPALRQTEAEAAAAAHRLAVARDGLDAEETRAKETKSRIEQRLAQIAGDSAREQTQHTEAGAWLERLVREADAMAAEGEGEQAAMTEAAAAVQQATRAIAERQAELDAATAQAAAKTARRTSLAQQIGRLDDRLPRLEARVREIAAEIDRLVAAGTDGPDPAAASAAVDRLRQAGADAGAAAEAAELGRIEAQDRETERRDAVRRDREAAARLEAEEAALADLLGDDSAKLWPPIVDAVTVEPGYEAAFGAALGDDLNAPADAEAPVFWAAGALKEGAPPLPAGAAPLDDFVTAPAVLARRLAQIGVVEDADGPRLAGRLAQGQRLVSRNGGLWRWDGFTVKPGARSAAATRLEQRNRLVVVRRAFALADRLAQSRQQEMDAAAQALARAAAAEQAARHAMRRAEADLQQARDRHAEAARQSAERTSRLAALEGGRTGADDDLAEARQIRNDTAAAMAELPAAAEGDTEIHRLRDQMEALRDNLADARATHETIRRAAATRAERADQIGRDRQAWANRADDAERQLAALDVRRREATAELAAVAAKPAEIAERRARLLDQIAAAEGNRDRAADALAFAETELAERDAAAKAANGALSQAREERIRREGLVHQADQVAAELALRIREALDCAPDEILARNEIAADLEMPDRDALAVRLERLKRERDTMGPVNLRAEIESREIQEKLDMLVAERADLEAAIARLRRGIASLNREGRERLLAAFRQVDGHFQELFVQAFGGGRAHLALTESDDPLEAGLEIMARPPGKRLQVMSLLSGGEQALTALTLLFAVFLTSPAPVCVLDEVDAPLDDANVERLCDLLDQLGRTTDTRFLVVTHNPITMARMDRLFGVTMAERGISRLVSVDLTQAEALRESA